MHSVQNKKKLTYGFSETNVAYIYSGDLVSTSQEIE